MKVLALHLGHTATAALGADGAVLAAISQEKADNIKNSSAFPADAIRMCLDRAGVGIADVDHLLIAGREVFPARCYAYLTHARQDEGASSATARLARSLRGGPIGRLLPGLFAPLERRRAAALIAEGEQELAGNLAKAGLGHVSRRHLDHHECHARAAFHGLDDRGGTEPALILTLDGSGDGIAGSVSTWRPGEGLRRIAAIPVRASLGGIYSQTTRFLGMRMLEHEYKVMGLAPYAKSYAEDTYRRVFKGVIEPDPQSPLSFRSTVDARQFYDHLCRTAVGERFDNLAGAVQHFIETLVLDWVQAAIKHTGIRRVFTGGGLFMNVKLNMRIQALPEVERAYFMPSSGDESLPLGALYAGFDTAGIPTRPLANLYLGPAFGDASIEHALTGADDLVIERPGDLTERVADLLAAGAVVARAAGASEWGARSLGNRAILAHPGRMESFHEVNDRIKVRDFWMPFAPTILDRRAGEYLKDYDPAASPAPHMITAFEATATGVHDLRAALHQGDHTLRPQVLTPDANPEYYRLIEAFEHRTGIGALLNTSLNLHGYPLAATPEQALFTLRHSGLQHLMLGPFLVSKRLS